MGAGVNVYRWMALVAVALTVAVAGCGSSGAPSASDGGDALAEDVPNDRMTSPTVDGGPDQAPPANTDASSDATSDGNRADAAADTVPNDDGPIFPDGNTGPPPPPPPVACDVLGTGAVASLAWSPDGARLAVGTFFGAVQLIRTSDNGTAGTIWAGRQAISSVDYSADGARLLVVSNNEAVRVFQTADLAAKPVSLAVPSRGAGWLVSAARFGPDGAVLVSYALNPGGSFFGRFDPANGTLTSSTKVGDGLKGATQMVLSSDRKLAALVGEFASAAGSTIQVRRTMNDQVLYSFGASNETAAAAGFSTDGALFAGGPDLNGMVRVLHAETGQDVTRVTIGSVSGVAFSPDNARMFLGEAGFAQAPSNLVTAMVATGMVESRVSRSFSGSGNLPLVPSPDGKLIASADDYTAIFIDAQTTGMKGSVPGPGSGMLDIQIAPDGSQVAIGYGNRILLWTPATGAQKEVGASRDFGQTFAYSPDGKKLAVALTDGLQVYDSSGGPLWFARWPAHFGLAPAFSPDGTSIAVAHISYAFRLYDAATGTSYTSGPTATAGPNLVPIEFSPDGTKLAVGERVSAVFDPKTRTQIATLPPDTMALTYSPDGQWLVTETHDTNAVRLFQAGTTTFVRDLNVDHLMGYRFLSFSSDSRFLAVSNLGKRLEILRLADEVKMTELPALGLFARFSKTGGKLAAAAPDGAAVWMACRLPAF